MHYRVAALSTEAWNRGLDARIAGRSAQEVPGGNEVFTKRIYIITGAAGFLGNNLVRQLQDKPEAEIRCLLLPGTSLEALQGLRCQLYYGSVTEPESLKEIFTVPADIPVCVIHCAGIVDIRSGYDPKVYAVNVQGTEIVARKCLDTGARMVYISSVHAMPPGKGDAPMQPAVSFDPDTVTGLYSKAKAQASRIVQDLTKEGLDAVIIQPSGLIGPDDYDNTNMSEFFCEAAAGRLPAYVRAGYSFVDVRDAAAMIISACTQGVSGETYLCAGPTISMMTLARMAARFNQTRPVRLEVGLDLVEAAAPVTGIYYRLSGKKPLFTAFAASTLKSDSNFDVSRSVRDLGFTIRPVEQTVQDIIAFQQRIFRLDADALLSPKGPIRPRKNPARQMAGLAAAGLGMIWLAKKAAGKSHR